MSANVFGQKAQLMALAVISSTIDSLLVSLERIADASELAAVDKIWVNDSERTALKQELSKRIMSRKFQPHVGVGKTIEAIMRMADHEQDVKA